MRLPILLILLGGLAAMDRPAWGADAAGESVLGGAAVDEPALKRMPSLVVRGGVDEMVYRGWPVRIEFRGNGEDAKVPGGLVLKGPSGIETQAAPHVDGVWLIAEEKSKSLQPGSYTFSVGEIQCAVQVVDEPATLTPELKAAKQSCRIAYAMAEGDLAAAEKLARDWVKDEPQSIEAEAALGDILAESGNLSDALDAYHEAISHVKPGAKAPRELYRRAAVIQVKLAAEAAVPVNDAPSVQEAAYYKLIAEGDAAMKVKNDAAAIKTYERAKKYHADHKLTVKLRELDEKIEFAKQRQATPAKAEP